MRKRITALTAVFMLLGVIVGLPLAEAAMAPAASAHQMDHGGCPDHAAPSAPASHNGHGFAPCCGISCIGFGDTAPSQNGVFFVAFFVAAAFTLFIPSRISNELFRPPRA